MNDATRIEAGCRAVEIMTSILEEHEDLYVSLACTGRLLAHGAPAVIEEISKTYEDLQKKDPSELVGLIDLLPVNPFIALLRAEPPEVFKKVERQMSIAALITGHAFFESILKQLLQLTILCDRQSWITEIRGKSVVFSEVQTKGVDACVDEAFVKELNKLGMAGMPAMVGRLLSFCKGNVTTKSEFQNYTLDLVRLEALDQLRHDYAHRRTKAVYSIKDADRDLRYLTLTGVHLVLCIMTAFDLKGQHRELNVTE